MAKDTRELILVRLLEVAESIVGQGRAFRNRIEIPEKFQPCLVLLDADEAVNDDTRGSGRPANGPMRVTMTPELFLLLGKPSAEVGAALNAWRAKIIKTVLNDAALLALCHHGDARYEGLATGLASGRTMEGEAGFSFSFVYVLRPNDL